MPPQPTEQLLRLIAANPRQMVAYLDGLIQRVAEASAEAVHARLRPELDAQAAEIAELRAELAQQGERWVGTAEMAGRLERYGIRSRKQLLGWAERHPDLRVLADPPPEEGTRSSALRWPEQRTVRWFAAFVTEESEEDRGE